MDQSDGDGDGVLDLDDNCPGISNPDQRNTDAGLEDPGSFRGDACDDNDDYVDSNDNCLLHPNNGQFNSDKDTLGDACDNCPGVTNESQSNIDSDERREP